MYKAHAAARGRGGKSHLSDSTAPLISRRTQSLIQWLAPISVLVLLHFWKASDIDATDAEIMQSIDFNTAREPPTINLLEEEAKEDPAVAVMADAEEEAIEEEEEEPGAPELVNITGSGAILVDLEIMSANNKRRGKHSSSKLDQHQTPSSSKGSKGGKGAGAKAAPPVGPKHDVGVRGQLPRANHTALVSRFHPSIRPQSRYMHMASISKVGDRFVAAWQGSRIYEGYHDQRIWHTFSKDSTGTSWGPQRIIPALDVGRVQWSPVMHMDNDSGRLVLFYSESRLCERPMSPVSPPDAPAAPPSPPTPPPPGLYPGEKGQRMVPGGDIRMAVLDIGMEAVRGEDYGWLRHVSWSQAQTLVSLVESDGNAVPKVLANPLAVLSTGEWLLPFWREPHAAPPCVKDPGNRGSASVLRSRDGGKTWKVHGEITHPKTWLIENTLVELSNGSVLMLFRTSLGMLFQSLSMDKGRTWSEPTATAIPNPDSKVQMMRLLSGHLALVFNAHRRLKTYRKARSLLDLAVSGDDGVSWKRVARVDGELETGLREHYPTMVESERQLFVVYSKFYNDVAEVNRTDLGIHLVTIDLQGRLPELGLPANMTGPLLVGSNSSIGVSLGQAGGPKHSHVHHEGHSAAPGASKERDRADKERDREKREKEEKQAALLHDVKDSSALKLLTNLERMLDKTDRMERHEAREKAKQEKEAIKNAIAEKEKRHKEAKEAKDKEARDRRAKEDKDA